MFSFLRRRREQAAARAAAQVAQQVLGECQTELDRTAKANSYFVAMPRDMSQRAALLDRARAAGVADDAVVQKLMFFQRLHTALNTGPDLETIDVLMNDARRLQIPPCDALRKLVAVAEAALFDTHGLRVLETDTQGRGVYLRCNAEFKNKPGGLEVRTDGLCFNGEVLIDVPWDNVAHVAVTSHTYQGTDYTAVAVQEGNRRTPTKFVFPNHYSAEHACKVVLAAWQQRGTVPEPRAAAVREQTPVIANSEPEPFSGYGYLGVVGESHYQDTLRQVAIDGKLCSATLVPEPDNVFDVNAVAVQISGMTVGYLSRPEARRYQRRLLALEHAMVVPAKLIGGTDEKPSFGVLLDCREVEALRVPKRTRKKQQAFDASDEPF
jgi:hypothetical protein